MTLSCGKCRRFTVSPGVHGWILHGDCEKHAAASAPKGTPS